jgi:alpha-L-fucosidase
LSVLYTQISAQQNNVAVDSATLFQAQQLKQTEQNVGPRNSHPNAQWFPKAGLGLFINWGLIAVNGSGDLSWCMLASKPVRRLHNSAK